MVEVSGANCPSCNGCYIKLEEYYTLYIGPADQYIHFDKFDGHWYIMDLNNTTVLWQDMLMYKSTSSFDGPTMIKGCLKPKP